MLYNNISKQSCNPCFHFRNPQSEVTICITGQMWFNFFNLAGTQIVLFHVYDNSFIMKIDNSFDNDSPMAIFILENCFEEVLSVVFFFMRDSRSITDLLLLSYKSSSLCTLHSWLNKLYWSYYFLMSHYMKYIKCVYQYHGYKMIHERKNQMKRPTGNNNQHVYCKMVAQVRCFHLDSQKYC